MFSTTPSSPGLESNALAANQNLRAAVARVDQARAAARLTRSQFFPELTLDPSFSRQRVSGNEPLAFPVKLKPVYLDTYNVPLDLSYEVDLWGRVRRSFQSAGAQAQATVADSQNMSSSPWPPTSLSIIFSSAPSTPRCPPLAATSNCARNPPASSRPVTKPGPSPN
jgi:outer membrane protein TolC